jgi:hypothetical protein
VPEPVFMIQVVCNSDVIPNPFGKGEFQKKDLSAIIILIDFIVIFSLIIFAYILNSAQLAYVAKFQDDTLEMTDFTIRVKNLPHDAKYLGEDMSLKAFLMAHFESVIKNQINKENKKAGDEPVDFDDISIDKLRDTSRRSISDIADINFGMSTMYEF